MMTPTQREQVQQQIEELQLWFANKPYGWYDAASGEQRSQWDARSAEQDRLIDLLNG